MISREEPLWCDDERRNAVLEAPAHPLNGVDFVEYARLPGPVFRLDVRFLKPPPAGLVGSPASFGIEGGIRIVGIEVLSVLASPDPLRLQVLVDREGDLSTYWLHVDDPAIDDERSEAAFSFKAGCPSEFDCAPRHDCEPATFVEPTLDYLAKDYQSFRRLLMDLGPQLNPDFTERNPSDLTVSLIELFAYTGDYLSYFQDWAATEAFFDTCRDRVSAARHARLIDYRMHQGRNAHCFVQFDGAAGVNGIVFAGTQLITRVTQPLRGQPAPPPLVIPAGTADLDSDPALQTVTTFETAAPVRIIAARNLLRIHDWGDAACCLAKGAREAWLFVASPIAGSSDLMASRPDFAVGEYLLLEEVLGAATGLVADADRRHRQVVRLEFVESASDEVFRDRLVGGNLTPAAAGDTRLPLLHVRWRIEDATSAPFCLSARQKDSGQMIPLVTIARGNVAPADHGRTVIRQTPTLALPNGTLPAVETGGGRWPIDTQLLPDAPLTFQAMPEEPVYSANGRLAAGRHDLDRPAGDCLPAVTVRYGWGGPPTELFEPRRSLIGSSMFDPHFVAEVGNAGDVRLRFGDDQYARRIAHPDSGEARYRIGNGRPGNIGAEALHHVIIPDDLSDPANPSAPAPPFPAIIALRQPLAASGGVDPQPVEEVRQLAPEAFRAETFRAVTEADYQDAALKLPEIAAAKARFLWTGSWHTVFVALHPVDPALLDRLPGGGATLKPALAARAEAWLNRYRLAGYDLVVRAAIYVPIELEIALCIRPGHFRGEVLREVTEALSNRRLGEGRVGFFHPLNFRFGTAVYASRIYTLLQQIDGVESARIRTMKRYWDLPNGELERGLIELGPNEVARLDNSRNQPEFGVLRLTAVGGL